MADGTTRGTGGNARLADGTVDEELRVVAVTRMNETLLRLMEMGLVPGAVLRVRRRAAFGGPLEIDIGQTRICMRKETAHTIVVEPAAQ
jgi:Fe2+ transport system protein FeoA